jgi:hypothetical protein
MICVRGRGASIDGKRGFDQPEGLYGLVLLELERTQQVQRRKLPRLALQNLPVERLGFTQAALVMEPERLVELSWHRPRLSSGHSMAAVAVMQGGLQRFKAAWALSAAGPAVAIVAMRRRIGSKGEE